jgi:hypothetical protein
MPLINCPECGRQVSTAAKTCPACGFPVAEKLSTPGAGVSDELLAEVRPSWWSYFWLLLFCWLIIPFFIAWAQRSSMVMRVYRGRIALRRGIFSRSEREIFMSDIRSVDVEQGVLGRMVNIGDITLSTAATVDAAETLNGIPNPGGIRDLIIAQRQAE